MPNADPVTPDQVVQRSVRFPTDIADALAARAARERRSVNSLIVVAVEAYLRAAAA